jgi:AcrR family transcriptional regulator
MRLSATVRREQLLSAAMRLFALQGFDGTTTREIAQAAEINEAIIFRHFPSKEDLYWAVVASRIQAAGRQQKVRAYLESGLRDREVLSDIAESFLDRNDEDANLTRLLLFSALRNSKLADKFFRTYMAGTYELLAGFIRRGVKKGRFRNVDPVIGARAFLGMISSHILLQELFAPGRNARSPRAMARQLADLWLNGISLSTSKLNGTKTRPKQRRNGNGSTSSRTNRDINKLGSEFILPTKQNGHSKAERKR